MVVTSNTSPICNLAIIGRLDLLRVQFREVWIPGAVRLELDRLSQPGAATGIQRAIDAGWLKPRALRSNDVARVLQDSLHPGEAEAIALALESSADLILLDEKDGRRTAERAGLRVTGVLGILLRAKKTRCIETVGPEIEALRSRARFFVSQDLERRILEAAGE